MIDDVDNLVNIMLRNNCQNRATRHVLLSFPIECNWKFTHSHQRNYRSLICDRSAVENRNRFLHTHTTQSQSQSQSHSTRSSNFKVSEYNYEIQVQEDQSPATATATPLSSFLINLAGISLKLASHYTLRPAKLFASLSTSQTRAMYKAAPHDTVKMFQKCFPPSKCFPPDKHSRYNQSTWCVYGFISVARRGMVSC